MAAHSGSYYELLKPPPPNRCPEKRTLEMLVTMPKKKLGSAKITEVTETSIHLLVPRAPVKKR